MLTERLHFTLHHLGDYDIEHNGIVETARSAGASVTAGCFAVELDRATNFGGMFVLTGGAGVAELKNFQRALGQSMTLAGLGKHVQKNFTPHVTVLYGDNDRREIAVEPIRWTVREFVLIHSLLGETKHTVLGRWNLRE
jgi:2'-5' RNA ligase